jgi:hypothetical protein
MKRACSDLAESKRPRSTPPAFLFFSTSKSKYGCPCGDPVLKVSSGGNLGRRGSVSCDPRFPPGECWSAVNSRDVGSIVRPRLEHRASTP